MIKADETMVSASPNSNGKICSGAFFGKVDGLDATFLRKELKSLFVIIYEQG